MQRTNIYLEERQAEAMDLLARQEGVSRAEIVRRLIDEGLSRGPAPDAVREAIAESFGVLRGVAFPGRTETQRDRYLEELWGK